MGINTPRQPNERQPKTDSKSAQSPVDKVRESTQDKVHKTLDK